MVNIYYSLFDRSLQEQFFKWIRASHPEIKLTASQNSEIRHYLDEWRKPPKLRNQNPLADPFIDNLVNEFLETPRTIWRRNYPGLPPGRDARVPKMLVCGAGRWRW